MDEFYSHYYYDGEAKSPADGGADVSDVFELAGNDLRSILGLYISQTYIFFSGRLQLAQDCQ